MIAALKPENLRITVVESLVTATAARPTWKDSTVAEPYPRRHHPEPREPAGPARAGAGPQGGTGPSKKQ